MFTDPAPSFIPFTCPVSVARELSGSPCRIFPPGATWLSHTVALGSTIGVTSDPWGEPEWDRPVSISRPSACRDRSSRSHERVRAVRRFAVAADCVPAGPPFNVTRAIFVQLRVTSDHRTGWVR